MLFDLSGDHRSLLLVALFYYCWPYVCVHAQDFLFFFNEELQCGRLTSISRRQQEKCSRQRGGESKALVQFAKCCRSACSFSILFYLVLTPRPQTKLVFCRPPTKQTCILSTCVHFGTAFHSNNTCETSYGIDVRSTPGHFPTIGLYAKLQLNYLPPPHNYN